MDKRQLEAILDDLDVALVKAFPEYPPLKALMVGGASLVFQEVTARQTGDIDIIIFDLMGSTEEDSLIFTTPLAVKIRRVIMSVGAKYGFKGEKRMVVNDDCAPFILELSKNELPDMRLFKAYQKIHLFIPDDLTYLLALKLLAGRPDKDFSDIQALCQRLGVQVRADAQRVVDRYFPSPLAQRVHQLPETLAVLFS